MDPLSLAQEEKWYENENQLNQTNGIADKNFTIEFEGRHIGGCGFHLIAVQRS
jgi:hypothetical protein